MTALPAPTLMFEEASHSANAVAWMLSDNRFLLQNLGRDLRAHPPQLVVTCGRGSSDHAATFAKYLIETTVGVPVASAAPAVASLYRSQLSRNERVLCLAISQSGRSPDIIETVETYRASGARTIVLTNKGHSPLARLGDPLVHLSAGKERSVAATKTMIASLAGVAAIVAEWAEDADLLERLALLPRQLREVWENDWTDRLHTLIDAQSMFVIGRGLTLAIAQEAALKLKETCGIHAEAYSSAEIRHGPMAVVGPGTPVLAFAGSGKAGDDVAAAAQQLASYGANVILVDTAARKPGSLAMPQAHQAIEPILMIQSFYRLANALSLARGFDPDKPNHLSKVTETR